jgi:hypothetical protein
MNNKKANIKLIWLISKVAERWCCIYSDGLGCWARILAASTCSCVKCFADGIGGVLFRSKIAFDGSSSLFLVRGL